MRIFEVVFIVALFFSASAAEGRKSGAFAGNVRKVMDGDTFEMESGRRVRLWGVDAPEMDTEDGKGSRMALARLVLGASLRCEFRSFDAYGRTVALCRAGKKDIAAAMVSGGHACEWLKYSKGFYAQERASALKKGFKNCVNFKHKKKGF